MTGYCGVKLEGAVDPDVGGQAMIYLGGSKDTFRCECRCNVFTRLGGRKYRCNSCNATYTAE